MKRTFILNLGSGLSLFSSSIVGALVTLLFLGPNTGMLVRVIMAIGLIGFKSFLFYQLVKSISIHRISKKLLLLYVADIVILLVLLFSNISTLLPIFILIAWVLISLILAILGLPKEG